MQHTAVEYLQKNRSANIDLLEIIRRGSAQIIYASDNGVLLKDDYSGIYMITADDEETAESILGVLDRGEMFEAHGRFIVPLIERRFGLCVDMECVQAAWLDDDLPQEMPTGLSIKQMDMHYLDLVNSMYAHGERDYIAQRLQQGEIFAAFDGDVVAGFIGVHVEGAIGMLEVSPNYRRRALGSALLIFMMHRQAQLGRFIYSQIETNNPASMAMHKKIGFHIYETPLYWME